LPDDLLRIVQFPHPGREHEPDDSLGKGWNLAEHRRKFMRAQGEWMEDADATVPRREGEIVFWGEWEAPSRLITELDRPTSRHPKYLFEPVWSRPPDHPRVQNTDPFVFGDRFLYSNCRQNTKRGPLKTQRLAPGSLVIFGSGLGGAFVVDTVFVVAHSRWVTAETIGKLDVDPVFHAVTLGLLSLRPGGPNYRLYEGATPDEPIAGMFSFVPCLPVEDPKLGFARPDLQLDGVVNPRNVMAAKLTLADDLATMKAHWDAVASQVLEQDLALGTRATMPRPEPGTSEARGSMTASTAGCAPPPEG
jgi:hypothetical protein